MFTSRLASLSVMSLVAAAGAQPIGSPAAKGPGAAPDLLPADGIIAALPYDGSTSHGTHIQDFEPQFDCYDTFAIEDFEIFEDARVTEFRSRGFGNNGNLFATRDFIGWVYEDDGSGLPGEGGFTGEPLMRSVVGVGRWDGEDFVTTFGGQCLPAGRYFLVYTVLLDFRDASSFLFLQPGDPTVGGGRADWAWLWNPGGCFGFAHGRIIGPTPANEPMGVNYILEGVPANCDCLADLNADGTLDVNDFFQYLDLFAAGDPLADLTGDEPGIPDGVIDVDDFFFYLDLFTAGCD